MNDYPVRYTMKYALQIALLVLPTPLCTYLPSSAQAQIPYRTYRPYSGADWGDMNRPDSYRNAPRFYSPSSTYGRRYRLYADINRPIRRYRVFPGYYPVTRTYEDALPDLYWPTPIPNAGIRRYGGYRGWGGYGPGWGGSAGYINGWGGAGVYLQF